MWCKDHTEEILDQHDVDETDLKFYDTEQIIETWNNIYICGFHGDKCCAMKGWGSQTIGLKGVRTKLITDLTVWWDHPPTEAMFRTSAKWADLVRSDDVLRTIS